MNYCPITYEPISEGVKYSSEGLRLLNRNLKSLAPLNFSAEQQRQEAISRAGKMSIQGLQLKLSAVLRISEGQFEVVDRGGQYILKPQSADYPELPENEDLTMRLAAAVGIEVPVHGLRINDAVLNDVIARFAKALPVWRDLLGRSFLSEAAKLRYAVILGDRQIRMQF